MGQLKTTYSILFFLNTCSFMKTITLARSKHIQTKLLYDTRGCQRNGEKPLLIHSADPAQPRGRGGEQPSRAPSAMGHPDVARTPAAGAESGFRGYLAVILIHISAFRGKKKRFLPNQQANLTQKGRAPPCSPWLQHPLPVLPAGQTSSPGTARVPSVGRAHPRPLKPSRCPALCWGVLGSAPCCGCPLRPPPRFPGAVGIPTRASGPRQGRDGEGPRGGTRGGGAGGLAWAVRSEEQGERRFCTS